LYKRFILEEKSSLHLHFTQPNVEKNPFLPPKKQLFEKKKEKKGKKTPTLCTEKLL
jgi:hypothetical protein